MQQTIQDAYLNALRKQKQPITIHIINGYQLNSVTVLGFDNFSILVQSKDRQQLVYKHAISTITPDRPVNMMNGQEEDET